VVLQAASHRPVRKIDIHIKYLILFSDIFTKRIGSDCHQSQVITESKIRFCQFGVKPRTWVLIYTNIRLAMERFCLQMVQTGEKSLTA
jgi:hypothetical protein